MENENIAIGWDTPVIENPDEGGGFRLLDPGTYKFTVADMKRGNFNGSSRMCACPKAIITCTVADEFGSVELTHNLYLNLKCKGLLADFFASIGLHRRGENLVPAWGQIVGCVGYCKINHRTYNDKTYNNIDKFLDPDAVEDLAPAASDAEQEVLEF